MKTLSASQSHIYPKLASLIRSGKISVVTGAGISTSGGVSDFRSRGGLFNEIKDAHGYSGEDIFTRSVLRTSDEAKEIFSALVCKLKDASATVEPTETHRMLAHIEKKHRASIYTQNIDGLERKAGIEKNVIYLHGNLFDLVCTHCKHIAEYTENRNRLLGDRQRIECPKCAERRDRRFGEGKRATSVGELVPNIVLYGDTVDRVEVVKKIRKDASTTVLLVMGTSLRVFGVKNLTKDLSRIATGNSGVRVYVGKEAPQKGMQGCFDYWIEGDCDTFSRNLLSALQGGYLLRELKRIHAEKIQEIAENMRRLSLEPSFMHK